MTVVLGLRCKEGLVLASDSQGTGQVSGGIPVKVHAEKVRKLDDHIVWAGTGAQGCDQRVELALSENLPALARTNPKATIAARIHQLANQVQANSRQAFVQFAGDAQPESWGGIFCGWADDGPWIMEIDLNGGWQFHDLVAATGSGHAFAHLAIGSVHHYDVAGQELEAAKAIAYRAIEMTYNVSAFGVGPPVQMAVVQEDHATVLDPDKRQEISELVNLWKAKEKDTLGEVAPASAEAEQAERDAPEEADEGLDAPA